MVGADKLFVHPDHNQACYRRQAPDVKRRSQRYIEKQTKTNQTRKIALDEYTFDLLTSHREMWQERCAELGVAHTPDAFLFSPAPDGSTPYLPRAISQRYRRFVLRLKLRSTRLHSLRYYSATELVAADRGWPTRTRERRRYDAQGLRGVGG